MKRNTSSHKWRAVILLTSFLIAALTVYNFTAGERVREGVGNWIN